MNRERLNKLLRHLQFGKQSQKWDYTQISTLSNTCGCAMGELPRVFPEAFKSVSNVYLSDTVAFFEMSYCLGEELFTHLHYRMDKAMYQVTRREVVVALAYVIAKDDLVGFCPEVYKTAMKEVGYKGDFVSYFGNFNPAT